MTELSGRLLLHLVPAAVLVLLIFSGRGRCVVDGAVRRLVALRPLSFSGLLLLVTLGSRLALLPTFDPPHRVDMREYVEKARCIARDGHPRAQEAPPGGRLFFRAQGWSVGLAGWFRATGTDSTRSAQVFGVVLAGAIALLVWRLGSTVAGAGAGRLAAALYAVYLPQAVFATLPYAETWATLLLLLVLLPAVRLRTGTPGTVAALGLAGGLGFAEGFLVVSRPEFLVLFPLTLLFLCFGRPGPRTRAIPLCLLFAAGALLPLTANHGMRRGYPGILRTSVQSGLLLYYGNNPVRVTGHANASPEVRRIVREFYREDPTGGTARDAAIEWMKESPLSVLANMPKKLYYLWLARPAGFDWHVRAGRPGGMPHSLAAVLGAIAWVQFLVLLILGVLGIARGKRAALFPIAILVLHTGMFLILPPIARYRLPLEPILLVAAAARLRRSAPSDT